MIEVIDSGDFSVRGGSASVNVGHGGVSRIQEQARDCVANSDLPDMFIRWLDRARELGLGDHDGAAIIKALRAKSN